MPAVTIKELFANDISRRIEEVIKVDQADDQVILEEIGEYVVTDSIRGHFTGVLERYSETLRKPHEGIAVWVSGFFGSGKSSFAKYLGLALENRSVDGESSARLLAKRIGDHKSDVLLRNIAEHVPTEAVIFDVSTDRGIRAGNQSVTEIMYRLFLHSLGYARDLDLSELEITLEETGQLDGFRVKYQEIFGKEWDVGKALFVIAVQQASRVMHEMDPATYPTADSWRESATKRADITPGHLALRCKELMNRRRPERTLLFVVDEVGQFVARDVQKMLDLQAVVQSLGRIGRRQDVDRRYVSGEAHRTRRRSGRQARRTGATHGPFSVAGPPRAGRHLRGDQQARPLEETPRPRRPCASSSPSTVAGSPTTRG